MKSQRFSFIAFIFQNVDRRVNVMWYRKRWKKFHDKLIYWFWFLIWKYILVRLRLNIYELRWVVFFELFSYCVQSFVIIDCWTVVCNELEKAFLTHFSVVFQWIIYFFMSVVCELRGRAPVSSWFAESWKIAFWFFTKKTWMMRIILVEKWGRKFKSSVIRNIYTL